jgi:hypothetical protein
LTLEVSQQIRLIMLVKSIYYFICQPYKTIDIKNGRPQVFVQNLDGG